MASNQRGRRDLDQSTRNHLSALDKLIEQQFTNSQPIQPDEFTTAQISEQLASKGKKLGESALNRKMNQLLTDGVVTMRKASVNGRQSKIFRFV
jgi:hypothetical protein